MTNHEMLELAMKAAGGTVVYSTVGSRSGLTRGGSFWDPREDSAQALELAVQLHMSVEISDYEESTYAYAGEVPRVYAMEMWQQDKNAATRLAIVRVAAQIQINKETK